MSDIWDNVSRDCSMIADEHIHDLRNNRLASCGSPIEQAFLATFVMQCRMAGIPLRWGVNSGASSPALSVAIEPQANVGRFRVDVLIGILPSEGRLELRDCIIVECDGHQFHEKTREQVAKDKARERELSLAVAKVIRFSGSEIFGRPGWCANEAMAHMVLAHNNRLERSDAKK